MRRRARVSVGTALSCLLVALSSASAQDGSPESQNHNWDLNIWGAVATGEEHLNSFSEAQILTAGFFVGRTMTGQIGAGSRRGSFEYGVDFMPVFLHFRPQRVYGGGLDPVILRWNSSLHIGRAAPYIELGGGAVRTSSKPPFG